MKFVTLFAAALFLAAQQGPPPVTAIEGVTIIDGTGAPARRGTVLIQAGRISAAGDVASPRNARIVPGAGYTLLPGLFDLHTHLSTANAPGLQGDWGKHLAAYLLSGVTTVSDLGSYGEQFEPRRRLLDTSIIAGPHVQMAYRITTPGGHGAEGGRPDIFSLEALTPREGRAAIQQAVPYKPDLIKIFTDGWRYGRAPDMTSMDVNTLQAAVDEAHKNGLPVITHTVTLSHAKDAARAKVDILGHAIQDVPVDDELIQLFRQSGITYVPTMAIYEPRGPDVLTPLLQRVMEPAAIELLRPPLTASTGQMRTSPRWEVLRANVTRLHAAGIPIAVGTDAGGSVGTTFHGWATQRELELLVGAGLTPLEAITAATSTSAKALRVDRDRGSIAPGKRADLLLVKGDPLADIRDLQNIERVWVSGKEVDLKALEALIASRDPSPLPSVKAIAALDDFEAPDGRLRWENWTDPGSDRSKMLFERVLRSENDHALTMLAAMAQKDAPHAIVRLPLQPGSVVPVDARAFKGVRFDVRGEGDYILQIPTYNVRDLHYFQAHFNAGAEWRTVRIPFESLTVNAAKTSAWRGDDLLSLDFEAARKAGERVWLELDNVQFY